MVLPGAVQGYATACQRKPVVFAVAGRVVDAGKASKAAAAAQQEPNYGPAQGCVPPSECKAERAASPLCKHACCLSSSSAVNASAHTPAHLQPLFTPAPNTTPAALPKPQPLGVRIPPLPSGQRPNFIVVLTDDQGFDDLGAHQPQQPGGRPQWVSTPNLDKFMQQSMEFRNFYVSPMCSQSRAELLTGRSYQRTGTMLINGGGSWVGAILPQPTHNGGWVCGAKG